jgi:tRNA:m4X modification enzyme
VYGGDQAGRNGEIDSCGDSQSTLTPLTVTKYGKILHCIYCHLNQLTAHPPPPPPTTTTTTTTTMSSTTKRIKKRPKVAHEAAMVTQAQRLLLLPMPIIPPPDHDRCHVYLPAKRRFCRQAPVVEVRVRVASPPPPPSRRGDPPVTTTTTPGDADAAPDPEDEGYRIARYCGNHRPTDAMNAPDDGNDDGNNGSEHAPTATHNRRRNRVPCPLDPTHTIWEDQVDKHMIKCPKVVRQASRQAMECYRLDHNRGGFGEYRFFGCCTRDEGGSAPAIPNNNNGADWAVALARRVMRAYHSTGATEGGIRMADLATPSLVEALQRGADYYRIKTGGPKHLHQHASLIGHLRRVVTDAFEAEVPTPTNEKDPSATAGDRVGTDHHTKEAAPFPSSPGVTLLEMGAGRGITGLLVAGVMNGSAQRTSSSDATTSPSAFKSSVVDLVLVDRGNARGKADTVLRRALTIDPSPHLDLRLHSWRRITCDLDHLHVPTLLDCCSDKHDDSKDKAKDLSHPSSSHNEDRTRGSAGRNVNSDSAQPRPPHVVVIAKHLCGSGTDVALSSLVNVKGRIRACAFATCCHGLCTWDDYVGRNFLGRIMTDKDERETQEPAASFGKHEFDLLARWSAGTVSWGSQVQSPVASRCVGEEEMPTEHSSGFCSMDSDDPFNVAKIAAAIQVEPAELGRACQRLIDFGRREFMQSRIFTSDAESPTARCSSESTVELVHYVPPEVTPQNALLLGWR